MSKSSSWDQMKRAREEEYFIKDEQAKIRALKEQRAEARSYLTSTHNAIDNFSRGFSPISGGSMFRAHVGDDVILDCPEEGVLTIPYDTLEKLLSEAQKPESPVLEKWREYMEIAFESSQENSAE